MKPYSLKIRNIIFYIAFCNLYLLTPLYYLFPQLSTVLPSSVVAGIPYMLMFVLLSLTTINNKWRIDGKVVGLLALIFILLLIAFFGNKYMSNIVFSTSFLTLSIFSLFILIEFKKIDVYRHLAFVVLLISAMIIYGQFTGLYVNDTSGTTTKLNYMSFGYVLTLMSMFLLEFSQLAQKKIKQILYMLVGILVAFFACVFGNRGALVIILLYVTFRFIKVHKRKSLSLRKIILTLFLFFGALILVAYRDTLLFELVNICNKLGLESRTLSMLIKGIFGKSDRAQIYSIAFELIKENPFVIRGPGAMLKYTMHSYNAHNIVLELCVEYGVIIAAVILFLIFKCFWRIVKLYLCDESFDKGTREKISFSFVLFMHSLVQLMFSSTLYECAGLWLGICASVVVIYTTCKYKKCHPTY